MAKQNGTTKKKSRRRKPRLVGYARVSSISDGVIDTTTASDEWVFLPLSQHEYSCKLKGCGRPAFASLLSIIPRPPAAPPLMNPSPLA